MSSETDQKALTYFLAATPLTKIRDSLGFKTTTSALAAVTRALKAAQTGKSPESARQVEIERLDSLYRQLYPMALQGDLKAVDQCLRIGEQRLRLMDTPQQKQQGLLKAYEDTIKALGKNITAKDEAVVHTGRMIAAQIDYAVTHGAGQEVTKALYLVPHLMNVLSTLGATPEARANLQQFAKQSQQASNPVDELQAFRMKKFGTV